MKIYISNIIPLVLLCLSITSHTRTDAARILAIFPIGARSHFAFANAVMRSLHRAGHHITFVTPFWPEQKIANFTVIDSSCLDYPSFPSSSIVDRMPLSRMQVLNEIFEWDLKDCVNTANMNFIQDLLKSNGKRFDIVMINVALLTYGCYAAVAEILNLPVIGLNVLKSWRNSEWRVGNPHHPALVPQHLSSVSNTETFHSRLTNVVNAIVDDLLAYFDYDAKMKRFYGQHFPALPQHGRKPCFIFTNGHPFLLSRPLTANVIDVGGIHVDAPDGPTIIPQAAKTFMDEATHGVIYFSFGSMLDGDSIPPEVFDVFAKVFSRIPQKVLWKLKTNKDNLSANVMTGKWFPQNVVLAHENVVAFITHCGISSMYEAIHAAKPLLMTPIYLDQTSNAKRLEELGVGIRLDLLKITEKSLSDALDSIVNDTRFKRRMEEVSRLIRDRPTSPHETVVFWTEYALKHNGAYHLEPVGVEMSLYQYLLLDVILFVIILATMVVVIVTLLFRVFSLIFRRKKRTASTT